MIEVRSTFSSTSCAPIASFFVPWNLNSIRFHSTYLNLIQIQLKLLAISINIFIQMEFHFHNINSFFII
jgi:hypothetical protein